MHILGRSFSVLVLFGRLDVLCGLQLLWYWHRVSFDDVRAKTYKTRLLRIHRDNTLLFHLIIRGQIISLQLPIEHILHIPHPVLGALGLLFLGQLYLALHGSGVEILPQLIV